MSSSATVPLRLDDALVRLPLIEVARDRALVSMPGVGRVLVDRDGHRRRESIDNEVSLDFLDGTVTALAELLVGRFSLRAAVVAVGGRAVALCGSGLVGKSTIAATLAARGHPVVADSVATVDTTGDHPMVVARSGELTLWPDAVERLALDPTNGILVRAGLTARRFAFDASGVDTPLALVVHLRPAGRAVVDREPWRGFDAVRRVGEARWLNGVVRPLGLEADAFAWSTRILRSAPMYDIDVSPRERDAEQVADIVLDTLAAVESAGGR